MKNTVLVLSALMISASAFATPPAGMEAAPTTGPTGTTAPGAPRSGSLPGVHGAGSTLGGRTGSSAADLDAARRRGSLRQSAAGASSDASAAGAVRSTARPTGDVSAAAGPSMADAVLDEAVASVRQMQNGDAIVSAIAEVGGNPAAIDGNEDVMVQHALLLKGSGIDGAVASEAAIANAQIAKLDGGNPQLSSRLTGLNRCFNKEGFGLTAKTGAAQATINARNNRNAGMARIPAIKNGLSAVNMLQGAALDNAYANLSGETCDIFNP